MSENEYKPSEHGIINLIQHQRNGSLELDLDEVVRDAVREIQKYGGTADITINLKIKGNVDESHVSVADDVKVKLPKAPKKPSLMFMVGGKGLVHNQVEQGKLALEPAEESRSGKLEAVDKVSSITKGENQ